MKLDSVDPLVSGPPACGSWLLGRCVWEWGGT
jgi:hypothetical protein